MSWKALFAVGIAGVVGLAACSSSQRSTRGDSGSYTQAEPRQEDVGAEREAIIGQADAWQPGIIRSIEEETLVLEPYQRTAGEARIQLEENVPVFEERERVSTEALTPGTDVRVFYRHDASGLPEVVAVEILSEDEAREVRGLFEGQPQMEEEDPSIPYEEDPENYPME